MGHSHDVKRILIVGGGTAGWMAAAYLGRFLRHSPCKITLVESAKIGSIAVGEATIPTLVGFVRNLRLDEDEFMRRCYATYKLGIRFIDWFEKGDAYWHTFGHCGGLIDGLDLFHFWLKRIRAGSEDGQYASYSLQALLNEADKAPRPFDGPSPIIKSGTYAYHLDANALAALLKEIATNDGVTHLFDEVREVTLDGPERIERINTESGRQLSADFYIDATGFQGLLIEKALGNPWIDWSKQLLCDRAVVMPLPRDPKMPPYTRSTGLNAGWMWQIPLSHRVGCGYVYSSAHIDDDAAGNELLANTSSGKPSSDLRFLNMRVGRRQDVWVGNCVSVGLASGFLEPLESTGIYFIQKAMDLLLAYFPDQTFNKTLIGSYNKAMTQTYEEVRDFIVLHYILSQRDDQPFWRDSRNVPIPDSLRTMMALYEESGFIEPPRATVFAETSYHHIFSGGRLLPRRHSLRADVSDFDEVCRIMDQIKKQNQAQAQTLPTHQELMQWMHRQPV